MSKKTQGFDLLSILFGASIVILAISIYMATAKITKKSIDDREMARMMQMEINHLHDRIDDMEKRSQTGSRIIEKMLSDIITSDKFTP
jgi:membrane protein insertase Oxa1/YidC/SpoIIIJ|tara:strand:+ start:2062 stop:2325 length:264 start_codon:yes stop_codon:yes gene_type:complete